MFISCDEQAGFYPTPNVEKVVKIGVPFIAGTLFSLKSVGYEIQEYFISGTANSYKNTSPLSSDGKWDVIPNETAQYKTRILVQRPIDSSKFNGTVLVEWLNVSGGADSPACWTSMHTEMIRRGYVWVGVSAQFVGVEGGKAIMNNPLMISVNTALKKIEPLRYKTLSHPGDSFSYDIFGQAAKAVRYPDPEGVAPLGDLKAERMIAMGQSQAAARMTTYINAFGKQSNVFDGFYVHSRLGSMAVFYGGSSSQLSEAPQLCIPTPSVVHFRDDLGVPVMNLQTETDLFVFGAVTNRQADNPFFRLWEVAGSAHNDYYLSTSGMFDVGDKASIAMLVEKKKPNLMIAPCPVYINSGPQHHFIANAALNALNIWVKDGTAPPSASRLSLNGEGTGFVYDMFGNTLGGIRSSYVDVPTAVLSGENEMPDKNDPHWITVCGISGRTERFDEQTLRALYPDLSFYIEAVTDSVHEAEANGFLMPEDGELVINAAKESELF
jgi:hypothetical protein